MKSILIFFYGVGLVFVWGCERESKGKDDSVGGHSGWEAAGGTGGEVEPDPGPDPRPRPDPDPVEGGSGGEPEPAIGGRGGDGDPEPNVGGGGGEREAGCPDNPLDEVCNSADDDCDGFVDEDPFPLDQMECETGFLGVCEEGQRVCNNGEESCEATAEPDENGFENDNGVDDDCDGRVDECIDGVGEAELCNAMDDDCDGQVDEGVMNACSECGELPEEVCNGLDDDCDGVVDESGMDPLCVCNPPFCVGMVSCHQGDCIQRIPNFCPSGTANCNPEEDDVCETSINYDRNHCGGCANACQGNEEICYEGGCVDARFLAVEMGAGHSCALKARAPRADSSGELLCWGDNRRGQLGRQTILRRRVSDHTPPHVEVGVFGITGFIPSELDRSKTYLEFDVDRGNIIPVEGNPQLALGSRHSCVIGRTSGDNWPRIYCWGDNTYGQLGRVLEDGESFDSDPQLIDWPEPGNPLRGQVLPIRLTSGEDHLCAVYRLMDNPNTKYQVCWGRMDQSQAGHVPEEKIVVRNGNRIALPGQIAGGVAGWESLTCGGDMCCRLVEARGGVECWGELRELGLGLQNSPDYQMVYERALRQREIFSLEVSKFGFCALFRSEDDDFAPSLECVGRPLVGQFPPNQRPRQSFSGIDATEVRDVSLGFNFGCVALDQYAQCWGMNDQGQLGMNPDQARNEPLNPVSVVGGAIHELFNAGNPSGPIVQISSNQRQSCVLYEEGRVVCWGDNSHGSLGRPPEGVVDPQPEPGYVPDEPRWQGW